MALNIRRQITKLGNVFAKPVLPGVGRVSVQFTQAIAYFGKTAAFVSECAVTVTCRSLHHVFFLLPLQRRSLNPWGGWTDESQPATYLSTWLVSFSECMAGAEFLARVWV